MRALNAAAILQLIRDGQANDLVSLCGFFSISPTAGFYITNLLDQLARAGLIAADPPGSWSGSRLSVTPAVGTLQGTLGFSLKQLATASTDDLTVTPYFGRPLSLGIPLDVFVVMPFNPGLLPIYQDHISKVAAKVGVTVKRADDFFSTHHVMADVWRAIWGARAIIADCTGRNPNVFYEIGMAHTVGRPVILITQNREDVPFDLQAIRYIQYEYTPRGMADFEQRLEETLRTVLIEAPPENPYWTATARS